jgi:hypothetical protein
MDLQTLFKDIFPLFCVLFILFVQRGYKKGKESEQAVPIKHTPPSSPVVESYPVEVSQAILEHFPDEPFVSLPAKKAKRRRAKDLILSHVILDKPLALRMEDPFPLSINIETISDI